MLELVVWPNYTLFGVSTRFHCENKQREAEDETEKQTVKNNRNYKKHIISLGCNCRLDYKRKI